MNNKLSKLMIFGAVISVGIFCLLKTSFFKMKFYSKDGVDYAYVFGLSRSIEFVTENGIKYMRIDNENHSLDSEFANYITTNASMENIDVFMRLVKEGCIFSDFQLINYCDKHRDIDFIKLMIEKNPSIIHYEIEGINIINILCTWDVPNLELIESLLKKKVKCNLYRDDLANPLSFAMIKGDKSLEKLLLKYGAFPNMNPGHDSIVVCLSNKDNEMFDSIINGIDLQYKFPCNVNGKDQILNYKEFSLVVGNFYAYDKLSNRK